MTAVIDARKSTNQNCLDEEQSVTRQVDCTKAYPGQGLDGGCRNRTDFELGEAWRWAH